MKKGFKEIMTNRKEYLKHTNEYLKAEQEVAISFNGEEVKTYICEDGCKYDGLGYSDYWNVKEMICEECGEDCSSRELEIFEKYSEVKNSGLCKECHAKESANMSRLEMAEKFMELMPCNNTDRDSIITLATQFKTRFDLAYMLMVVSNNHYNVSEEDYYR